MGNNICPATVNLLKTAHSLVIGHPQLHINSLTNVRYEIHTHNVAISTASLGFHCAACHGVLKKRTRSYVSLFCSLLFTLHHYSCYTHF